MKTQTQPWPDDYYLEYWEIRECLGNILKATNALNTIRAEADNVRYVLDALQDQTVTKLDNNIETLIFNCQKIRMTQTGRLPNWVFDFLMKALDDCGPTIQQQVIRLKRLLAAKSNDFDQTVTELRICEKDLREYFALGKAPSRRPDRETIDHIEDFLDENGGF